MTTEMIPEIEQTLREYTQLQIEEQRLKERKQELQDKLKDHLRGEEKNIWFPEIDGTRLKVSYRSLPHVEYDEETLRQRLGDRYFSLLEPDIRKLRTQLTTLDNELQPLLDRIGSPSADKVKAAVQAGTVSMTEFKGAFTKTMKEYISVAKFRQEPFE